MPRPPHIVWIVTTQWRAGACGYADDPNARTPYLDAFAAEAANFVEAVTPHPFGPFARAALLTGVPSPANGVRDYFDPLPTSSRTIAHQLSERGYCTAFFGKWHLAARDRTASLVGDTHARMVVPPENRGGFEFWEGFESGFLLNDPWLHGTRLPEPTRFAGYQSDVICARAAEWLRARTETDGDAPCFTVVSLEAPHPPYEATAPAVTPRDGNTLVLGENVPRGGEVERIARAELAGYYAHIEATDRAIGSLLKHLDHEETVIVFTSVHGDMHGAHGLFRKGWPYEESVRVPLLVHLPGSLAADDWNGRHDELVSLLDLPAWTMGWADREDVVIPAGAVQQISMPSIVAVSKQCDRAWRGVRSRLRKLVLADEPSPNGGYTARPWLYFDLRSDPQELHNLADDPEHATEIEALRSLIKLPPPHES